jgi:putative ABC transport system substrate-binding protein
MAKRLVGKVAKWQSGKVVKELISPLALLPFPPRKRDKFRGIPRIGICHLVIFLFCVGLLLVVFFGGCSPPGPEKMEIGVVVWRGDVDEYQKAFQGFKDGLSEGGYVEGKNVFFKVKDADGDKTKVETFLQQVTGVETPVYEKPNLLLVIGTSATQIAAEIVKNLPVVFTVVFDASSAGVMKDGKAIENFTGTTYRVPIARQMEVFQRILPQVNRLGVVYSNEPNSIAQVQELEEVAKRLDIQVVKSPQKVGEEDLGPATERLVGQVDAIFAPGDTTVERAPEAIISVAEKNQLPIMAVGERNIEKGALFGLTPDTYALGKETAKMALRITMDAKPSDIPIVSEWRFRLVINQKTAETLGITIPPLLLSAADRIIR